MQKMPPLFPFLTNKYMPLSEISSNYILVILSIASQLNLGLRRTTKKDYENNDKDLIHNILSIC